MSDLTLTEFLLARIAEDEERAEHERGFHEDWPHDGCDGCNPERVLAECEAKWRIVSRLETDRLEGPRWKGYHLGWRHAQFRTLRLLALPYADHPDYREEWK